MMTTTTPPRWNLVIHGGAGLITPDKMKPGQEEAIKAALAHALGVGSAILQSGGTSLDAVEAAVRVLEDDPNFNAGRGAALSFDGVAELDAAIMDGRDRDAGAVARVTTTRNPVSLARAVMENSRHVFLAGIGADAFSQQSSVEQADPEWFITPERRANLIELKANNADAYDVDMKYGTVGAVAVDSAGHVAAATSTGGTMLKRPGRVGDTPLIGCGTFADDARGACSCTGLGEAIIKATLARQAVEQLGAKDPSEIAAHAVAELTRFGGDGGLILVDARGRVGFAFNSQRMARAWIDAEGREGSGFGR